MKTNMFWCGSDCVRVVSYFLPFDFLPPKNRYSFTPLVPFVVCNLSELAASVYFT